MPGGVVASGIDRRRLVEVWAGPGPGGWSLGTGTWLAEGLILTARHVVTGKDGLAYAGVKVRRVGGKLCEATVVWPGAPGLDAALLAVTGEHLGRWDPPVAVAPLRWGRLCGQGTGVDVQVAGFPDSVTPEVGDEREVEQADGVINPVAGSRADRHLMTPGIALRAADDQRGQSSLWKGISGAGVMCGELLCGIVIEDPRAFDSRRLKVLPAHVLARAEGFRKVVEDATGRRLHLEPAELQGILTPWYSAVAPASPAALLRPEYEFVPFRPRPQLAELHAWCDTAQALSGVLMTGSGGQGKSRLARQLARERAETNWAVGHLADLDPADYHTVLARMDMPLLLVIDYAETRTAILTALITHLAQHPTGHPVRLLLLGRTDGDWWDDLLRATAPTAALRAPPVRLSALEHDADLTTAYRDAAHALAAGLTRVDGYTHTDWTALPLPDPAPGALTGGHALTVHMTALAALLSAWPPGGTPAPASAAHRPEDMILAHERTYWDRTADRRKLGLESLRLGVVSAALLAGAATFEQATTMLSLLPGLEDDTFEDSRRKLAVWIHDLYPTTADPGSAYWGTLHPDRLTEHHLTHTLTTTPENRLLGTLLPHLDPQQATRALTVLTRALALPAAPDSLAEDLRRLITTHPGTLAVPAIIVAPQAQQPAALLAALHTICHNPDLSMDLCHQLYEAIPQQTQRLAEHALALTDRQVTHCQTPPPTASRRRWWRPAHLRQTAPDPDLPDLAAALHNQSIRLADLGRREEALTAITRAAESYEVLAQARPDAFLPDLATALNNQSSRLSDLGWRKEALTAVTRAVDTYEVLAQARPNAFLSDFAMALNNQSNRLADLGRREEALTAITRAVDIREVLAQARPDAFLPDLATALNNQSNRLADLGRREEALTAITRAVDIREVLAQARPDAFLPDLATALNNQAAHLADLGRREEALTAITRAVDMYEVLAGRWPDAFAAALDTARQAQAFIQDMGAE